MNTFIHGKAWNLSEDIERGYESMLSLRRMPPSDGAQDLCLITVGIYDTNGLYIIQTQRY